MALSSETLFHFTNSFDVLCAILKEGFWPKYSKETGWKPRGEFLYATPIVSFCDIPLSQVHKHIEYYGYYGVGISKEWAVDSQKISPVLYVTKDSLNYFGRRLIDGGNKGKTKKERFLHVAVMLKPYKGWNWKSKGTEDKDNINDNYLYYDEREWRYFPNNFLDGDCVDKIALQTENEPIDWKEENAQTREYSLKVPHEKVKYIILKEESERLEMLKRLDKIFSSTCSADDLALLKSKILTCAQIERDF